MKLYAFKFAILARMRLRNKIAIITGGTSGIGKATVERFAKEGATVVFTGRRAAMGRALEERLGGSAHFMEADHRRAEDCERVVNDTRLRFGRVDVLFNNAGVIVGGTAEKTSEADWHETLLVNVTGVWRMSKMAVPVMRAGGGGSIINNASDWGLVAGREAVAYCASKGAVVMMTKAMAIDHAREKIRVNAVCPGDTFVERWASEGYFRKSEPADEMLARMGDNMPMGRVGEAHEIASAVLFLASDESSFVTGTTLLVDGGFTAQ